MKSAWFILLVVLISGCGRHRQVVKLKAVRNSKLVENLHQSQLNYDWFSAKVATSVDDGTSKKSFKTIIKMRKDSMIWMSISPLLGIEIARVVITPDSIKFIDKINNQYFKGDMDYLNEEKNINVDFHVLQEMIAGNAILFNPEEKFRSVKMEESYMLTAKTDRKFRKAVGLQNGKNDEAMTQDTISFYINERKYRKAVKKNDDEDLIIKRYWISPANWKPVKTIISDVLYDRIIEVDYQDFKLMANEEKYFPYKIDYAFSNKQSAFQVALKYNKVRINKKSNFPFKIPKGFEPINLPE